VPWALRNDHIASFLSGYNREHPPPSSWIRSIRGLGMGLAGGA